MAFFLVSAERSIRSVLSICISDEFRSLRIVMGIFSCLCYSDFHTGLIDEWLRAVLCTYEGTIGEMLDVCQ